ncbi:putative tryptophan synthase [Catenaria anguillulae PL171]|uniref:Tryptophan synthase n=1 Tax=Catenaria anguillulae PL171 TaxID=765915 RepID=A0A1Y2HIC2_9FUNG|nr:putative tryptophan synthase [Catenaria anguillulae PL171]
MTNHTSLKQTFAKCAKAARPAFVAYTTAGYPDLASATRTLLALQAGGADILELGVPFTDPLADGPTIQHSTHVALNNGVDLATVLDITRAARAAGLTIPVLLMGYYNPFLQYDGDDFVGLMRDCAAAGVDGFIVVDLPPEESATFRRAAHTHGLSYVPLITPSTSLARIGHLAPVADSFIYVVSRSGVTGERANVSSELPDLIKRIRSFNKTVPLAVGFGVATRQHFKDVAKVADGVVIGSKIINVIKQAVAEGKDHVPAVEAFARMVTGADEPADPSQAQAQVDVAESTKPAEEPEATAAAAAAGYTHLTQSDFLLSPRFGDFGGQYVPESLVDCLRELEAAFVHAKSDPEFWAEFHSFYPFIGRPSPLHLADRMTAAAGGARIWLKREDLNHTGSHKINNALGQILLAKRLGKKRIIAETGAGQHGVATATVCAKFGLECVVYMGAEDCERQRLNVFRIQLLGGKVVPVESGSRTLKDAINEAMRDWVTNVESTHYLVGSAIGPHPFPRIVREFQSVIGKEAIQQFREKTVVSGKLYPDAVMACVGGGSNAIGLFGPIADDPLAAHVRIVGVEAAGHGIGSGKHSATLACGVPGVLHGTRTYLLQDAKGQVTETHSVSAGLDYPGVGPEHAHLKFSGRAEYVAVTDDECMQGFKTMAELEGIIPALETAHAVFAAMKVAKEMGHDKDLVLCVSGRGDKDVNQVMKIVGFE